MIGAERITSGLSVALVLFGVSCGSGDASNPSASGGETSDLGSGGTSEEDGSGGSIAVGGATGGTSSGGAVEPGDPCPSGCLIDNECVEAGALHPDTPCKRCLPAIVVDAWTNDDTAQCDDGVFRIPPDNPGARGEHCCVALRHQ